MFLKNLTAAALLSSALVWCGPSVRGELEWLADDLDYDHAKREVKARGNSRLRYEGNLLTANEILYNDVRRTAAASGEVTFTHPDMRVVGDAVSYNVEERRISGRNLRFGQPPFHAEATRIRGGQERIDLEGTTVFLGEPQPGAVNLRAGKIRYFPDDRLEAEDVTIRIGRVPVFYLPSFKWGLSGPGTTVTADAGYSGNLGAFGFVATRTPLTTSFSAGPEFGLYSERGALFGPGFDYQHQGEEHVLSGGFAGGYIHDTGEVGLDRLGRPIDDDRYYAEWRHKQRVGESLEFTGQANVWSDSEVTRDFRPRFFRENQFPDNFFETAYLGEGYLISLFTRISADDFQVVQERLPEVRFDLLPRPVGDGFYQQLQASGAVLREEDPLEEALRSDRLDLYYGISRPTHPTGWLTVTPKAGMRATHYQRARAGRDTYTRALGEIGVDAEANAFAVYDYRNKLWRIDGIRHVVKPRVQYRYVPGSDRGAAYIPPIDQRVFSTQLEPIDLGEVRNIDDLQEIHTFRYGIDNVFQTRHRQYGSVDLLSLFVANDLRLSREPGQEVVSDVHTELAFTPIYWLRFTALNRISPQQPEVRESTAALTITDSRFWSARLGADYLQDLIEQYSLLYSLRLNELFGVAAEVRYDADRNRFSRQTYSLIQNLNNTWELQYQIYFREGSERESSTGFAISASYLSF